jgi:peptide/nickel transport system permease protein
MEKQKEKYFTATQFQLMWFKFKRHQVAIIGIIILAMFVFVMVFCEFLAPYGPQSRDSDYLFGAPQKVHFRNEQGEYIGPFVYAVTTQFNRETMQLDLVEDKSQIFHIKFISKGEPYLRETCTSL